MPEFIGRPNIPNSLGALLTELIAKEPSPASAAIGAVKDIALGGLEGLAKAKAKAAEAAEKEKEHKFQKGLELLKITTKAKMDQETALAKSFPSILSTYGSMFPGKPAPTFEQFKAVMNGGTMTKKLPAGTHGPGAEDTLTEQELLTVVGKMKQGQGQLTKFQELTNSPLTEEDKARWPETVGMPIGQLISGDDRAKFEANRISRAEKKTEKEKAAEQKLRKEAFAAVEKTNEYKLANMAGDEVKIEAMVDKEMARRRGSKTGGKVVVQLSDGSKPQVIPKDKLSEAQKLDPKLVVVKELP